MAPLHVAAAQYPIDRLKDLASYEMKLARWVAEAAEAGAKLLVFPEHAALELTSLSGDLVARDFRAAIEKLQGVLPEVDALHAALARRHEIHILAGSALVRQIDGGFVNVARLFAPSGAVGRQEKLMLTPLEKERWGIDPGRGSFVFETTLGRIGVAFGYDAEFPLLIRTLTEANAALILVPSCSDSLEGYHRVRVACAARALENQCYVAQSATVGQACWPNAIREKFGAANFFAPPGGSALEGSIAAGQLNETGWVHAELDFEALRRQRREGEARNFADWGEQPGVPVLPPAELVRLTDRATNGSTRS